MSLQNIGKIANIKRIVKSRISNTKKKSKHFKNIGTDALIMNNEVTENFNFELEKARSAVSEMTEEKDDTPLRRKKLRLPSVYTQSYFLDLLI